MADYKLKRIYFDALGYEYPKEWEESFDVQKFSMITMQSWDGIDFRLGFKGEDEKKAVLSAMEFETDLLFISNKPDHIELAQSLDIAVLGFETDGHLNAPYIIEDISAADADYLEKIYRRAHGYP
ncbi:MAG: hypothetical protein K6G40_01860 [Eubacterium sp.]|nr:hypothetical protein [Eubacterium sp.]